MMAMVDVVSYLPIGGPMAQVCGTWSKGRRPSGAVLHSSREPGVRRPCSDSWTCYGPWQIVVSLLLIISNYVTAIVNG